MPDFGLKTGMIGFVWKYGVERRWEIAQIEVRFKLASWAARFGTDWRAGRLGRAAREL